MRALNADKGRTTIEPERPERDAPVGPARQRKIIHIDMDAFFHPRGLTFLFTTEMWERFSYYGMRALLVLYMVK